VLTTRGRREADTRLEAADLRQRLEAAQAELQRKVSENGRLAAELAATHKAADAATVMAQGNLAVIDAQIKYSMPLRGTLRWQVQSGAPNCYTRAGLTCSRLCHGRCFTWKRRDRRAGLARGAARGLVPRASAAWILL
jgi:hypothetical protein